MNDLYLIARINGALVAIASDNVESVVTISEVIPVPKSNPSVAGLFALRSRVLTLIDSQYLITGDPKKPEKGALAVIAEIAGHHFGLLVEAVDDVVSIESSQIERNINPAKSWERFVSATASVDDKMVMILDPAALIGIDEGAIAA